MRICNYLFYALTRKLMLHNELPAIVITTVPLRDEPRMHDLCLIQWNS